MHATKLAMLIHWFHIDGQTDQGRDITFGIILTHKHSPDLLTILDTISGNDLFITEVLLNQNKKK
jgi:hypothetical protein